MKVTMAHAVSQLGSGREEQGDKARGAAGEVWGRMRRSIVTRERRRCSGLDAAKYRDKGVRGIWR